MAATLAAQYRKAGLSQSEAMKKAWSEIERNAQPKGKKIGTLFTKGVQSSTDSGLKTVLSRIAGIVGVAFSVTAVARFGAACMELGSNVEEVQNVVDTAFGGMADKMEAFADTSITNFGISKLAAKKTGSTYMAMAKGMNVAMDTASDMAVALTGLSGDVASYFNITQEEADTKLKGIFTGETEALKSLGVVMTQTNLDNFALANGFGKTTSAMSQSELVMLRYAFVTNALKDASGDFLKTQDSWANQTRILSMQWQEFMSVIGKSLITILKPLVVMLNQIMAVLIRMANTFNSVISAIFGGTNTQIKQNADSAGSVSDAIGSSVENQEALTDATKDTKKAANGALSAFDDLNVLQKDTAAGAGTATSGGALSGNLVSEETASQTPEWLNKIKSMISDLAALFAPTLSAWSTAFDKVKNASKSAFQIMQSSANKLLENGLKPLFSYVLNEFVPNIVNSFSTNIAPMFGDILSFCVMEWAKDFEFACEMIERSINDIILPAFKILETIFTGCFDAIGNTWSEFGGGILEQASTMFDGLRNLFLQIYENIIKPVLQNIMDMIDWLWTNHLQNLWQNLTDFFAAAAEMILALWNTRIAPFFSFLVDTLGPAVTTVINTIVNVIGTVVAVVSDVIGGIIRILTGLMQFLTGTLTGNWQKAWEGIKDIFGGIWDIMLGIVKGIVNSIIDSINSMISAIVAGVNAAINALNRLSFDVPDWVPDLGGKRFGFDIPLLEAPKIPKLAQGAVIPPNREFLAVLGDQTNGTNIEAPLETIKQAVAEVIAQMGTSQNGDIVLQVDGKTFARLIHPYAQKEQNRRGIKLIEGGVY